ncbi:hypothetical protein [Flagellimonas beolgyonensis]|uniref:hypothetical protein n=1 Tax=Flagellimonas beolgyonensis TaxID=864064 RepID=UPI003D652B40
MKLEQWKDTGRKYTEKASDISRTLVLSGIGIIWIIKTGDDTIQLENPLILYPLIGLALAVFLDFLQYLLGGVLWLQFYHQKGKEGVAESTEIKGDTWRRDTIYVFFYAKFIVTLFAYLALFRALFHYY